MKTKLLAVIMLLTVFPAMSQSTITLMTTPEKNESPELKVKKLPWLEGSKSIGDRTHIYIPDSFDYRQINEMMSGSGFGPGNGGNKYIFEVDSIVKKVIATVSANKEAFTEVDISKFEEEVKSIGVFFLNSLPNDTERLLAGANFSKERTILILKSEWEKMTYAKKVAFIFHEYLGVLGIEKENSFISNRISHFMLSNQSLLSFNPLELVWLYSRSNTDTFVNKFEFRSDQSGKITTKHGQDSFQWKVNSNVLFLQLSGVKQVTYMGWAHHPVSGEHMPVETLVTTTDLEITKLDSGFFNIKETYKNCNRFPPIDNSDSIEVCSFELKQTKELIGTKNLKIRKIDFAVNDYGTFPVLMKKDHNMSVHLVKAGHNSQVEMIEGHGGFKIKSYELDGDTLSYKTDHGHRYILNVIKKQNGIDRSIVTAHINGENRVSMEAFTIVKQGELPVLSNLDVVGHFLPIYSAARHTSENDAPYEFNADGFGGFKYGFDDYIQTTHWVWKFDGYKLNAKRYYYFDNWDNYLQPSKENLESCISGVLKCAIKNDRDYIILKKNGHRYTMLRLFRFYSFDYESGELKTILENESSSLWVMDKL